MRTEVPLTERLLVRRRLVSTLPRRALFVLALLLMALVSLLYLSQTSDVATTGYDIADLQAQQQQLQMQNEQLQLQIAQLESLDRIDQAASTRLHMGPPDHVVYVTAPPAVIPTPVASDQSTANARSSTPLGWLGHVINSLSRPGH